MKKKILYHFATDRNGGEFRRIKRLANDYDLKYSYHTLEVVILPVFFLFSGFAVRNRFQSFFESEGGFLGRKSIPNREKIMPT